MEADRVIRAMRRLLNGLRMGRKHPQRISNDFAGLESWGDPTPRASPFTLKELGDAWVAAAKRQLIRRPKSPTREELLRRRQEHDRKSLMIALRVYAEEHNIQPADLELIEVKERNLIDEEGKGYVHFNFVVKMQHNPSSLFFGEVHPDCREEEDVYLCTPLEANDLGDCYGCKDRAKELVHPTSVATWVGTWMFPFPSFTKALKKAKTRPDFSWLTLVSCGHEC
ncbi:uncharacterized protein LOC123412730 isoform X2 [Hordeum vulgare subsp. vulgare]|uniref:uncharacterized protein LOC123412730 isoform X2 n=1 Tax=Hordeum vulgare subsp. vulgare TaxID=112509 RepID=UPI001D1A4942|nr:uncharacterized protein LOC123412730 isoform X2 [Hordeum vulgare subsp. vulgare]